jgi:hypothetical protein
MEQLATSKLELVNNATSALIQETLRPISAPTTDSNWAERDRRPMKDAARMGASVKVQESMPSIEANSLSI